MPNAHLRVREQSEELLVRSRVLPSPQRLALKHVVRTTTTRPCDPCNQRNLGRPHDSYVYTAVILFVYIIDI